MTADLLYSLTDGDIRTLLHEIGWTSLCSPGFLKAAGYKKFGYKETHGMMTDVQELKERGLQVSCINLSCGYYEPHTDHEFTIKKDLMNCLSLVEHIIENCTDTLSTPSRNTGKTIEVVYDEFDEAMDEIFALLDQGELWSAEDLYYMYHSVFPELDMEDYRRIYTEYYNLNTIEYGEQEL